MKKILYNINKRFPHGSFFRNVAILASGTAMAQALSLCISPILTRIYPVESFGRLQVYIAALTFTLNSISLRYEVAILLPEDELDGAGVLTLSLSVVVMMTAVWGVVFGFLWLIGRVPQQLSGIGFYLLCLPFAVLATGLNQSLCIWALRKNRYQDVGTAKITQIFGQVMTQLVMGVATSTRGGLIVGDLVGRFAANFSLVRRTYQEIIINFNSITISKLYNLANKYRRFPLIATPAALIETAGTTIPLLLIGDLYGARTLGWLALTNQVLSVPVTLLGQAISQAYMAEASSLAQSSPVKMRSLFLKTIQRLAIIGVVPALVLAVFGPLLFSFVFGTSWRPSGEFARLLAVMNLTSLVAWPLIPTLDLLERQSWHLFWVVSRMGFVITSLLFCSHFHWGAKATIFVYGSVLAICYMIHLGLSFLAIQMRVANLSRA